MYFRAKSKQISWYRTYVKERRRLGAVTCVADVFYQQLIFSCIAIAGAAAAAANDDDVDDNDANLKTPAHVATYLDTSSERRPVTTNPTHT